ncbi:type VI immunity family protein [Corallococcus interemptor]|uniref:type VI immunity family protein n=1 Tax=Corallococcus interemptor TaxID=2316720 RepID=UPI003D059CAA
MTHHIPRIRVRAQNGALLIRDGLRIHFHMPQPHSVLEPLIERALGVYRQAVGASALGGYANEEGEWVALDEDGWRAAHQELHGEGFSNVVLRDAVPGESRYRFEYFGKDLGNLISSVGFWLPTEFQEEHGPARVRALALALASDLPFSFGQVGPSLQCQLDVLGVRDEVDTYRFRHPGMDVSMLDQLSNTLGTRVRGPAWMNFLGPPVLSELGGIEALRSRLHSPDTTVQALGQDRAVVTLGPHPEAGDTEQGQTLPAYRELARVLEPWLYQSSTPEERRWQRRFLD